jgi:signal transduction histidine kinase
MVNVSLSPIELEAMIEESYDLLNSNWSRSRQLAEKAASLSPKNSIQQLHSLIMLAICDFSAESMQESMRGLLDAIAQYQQQDKWLLRAYYYLGVCYHQFNLYSEATETHLKQYQLAETLGDKDSMAAALRFMGANHDHMGQPQLSLDYYDKSIAIYQSIDNFNGMAIVYYSKSIAYRLLARPDEAIAAAEKALSLYTKGDNPRFLPRIHGQMAVLFADLGNEAAALSHAEKAIAYAQATKLEESLSLAYLRQGMVYRMIGQIENSLHVLEKALAIVEAKGDKHIGIDVHQEMSKSYQAHQNYEKAFQHQAEYHRLYTEQVEEAMRSRFENLSIVHGTQQAQAEAERQRQLREQDRHYFETLNKLKDEFLSTASHDLKSPLSSMMTVLYLLKRHGRIDDERGKELLGRIENSANQMRDLITNLLDLARLETGKSLVLLDNDIVAFARDIVREFELVASDKGIDFTFTSVLESQILSFDSLMLERVFVNLLSNAFKFTPNDGRIELRMKRDDKFVLIELRDTGIGIAAKDLPHVFERFYMVVTPKASRSEGTGLGLAICKTIVEQHGGMIGVESREGEGSRFWFQLPIN